MIVVEVNNAGRRDAVRSVRVRKRGRSEGSSDSVPMLMPSQLVELSNLLVLLVNREDPTI